MKSKEIRENYEEKQRLGHREMNIEIQKSSEKPRDSFPPMWLYGNL